MSWIDTSNRRPNSSTALDRALSGQRLSRNGTEAASETLRADPAFAPQAFGARDEAQERDGQVFTVGATLKADLDPLAGLDGEQLMGELSRIDLMIKDRLETIEDPVQKEALAAGSEMMGETIRRLRLMQRGQDSLVLNR